ncbi:MAG: efflux RND transporter permease subunit, partial [Pseudomonadota bacterium]
MLGSIIRFSIRFRGVIIALAALLLIYGGYALSRAGLDIFPEFSPKQVIIQTESPGLTADQVELLVTQKVETAIGGLIGLKTTRSESIQGLSVITAIFGEDSDIYRNRQMVSERLSGLAKELPEGVDVPVPVPLSSSSATILTIGLSSGSRSLTDLRSLVDWTVVPRLLSVPGVADVNVFGGEVRQLQIQLIPDALRRLGLDINDVIQASSQATGMIGAGFLENENQRITLRVNGQPSTPERLGRIVLKRSKGRNIYLADVAEIAYAPNPPISAAAIIGQAGVVMMVIGQYGANTLTVSRAVEEALKEFSDIFTRQDITFHSHLFRPADYIETSLGNITGHLLIGGLFVIIVLYAFLFNFRTAFISALAIPLSLIGAAVLLLGMGVNLNVMVLGGLAIALGEVVDDAIIDTENIFRRLRENRHSPNPRPPGQVVYQASMEVRSSVVYASFIVALVFVPLLTLGGIAGRLFSPLGFSYILAILMSLGVALTLTPALCYLLLDGDEEKDVTPPLIRLIQPLYHRLLSLIAKHGLPVAAIGLLLCVIGVAASSTMGGQFLPVLREGHFIVHTTSIPGTSLAESLRIGGRLTQAFLEIPGVQSVSQWAGRAERGADTFGSHYSEYEVRLDPMPGSQQQEVLDRLRAILGEFPGIRFEANTFLVERVDETISGYTSPVVVNVYGTDLDEVDLKARSVADIIRSVEGATDVQLRSPPETPQLTIRMNIEALASFGLRPSQVMNALQVAYESRIVGQTYEGNRVHDVAVVLRPADRRHPESVGQLPIRTPDGVMITLDQVADIIQTNGRYNILHRGAQRL